MWESSLPQTRPGDPLQPRLSRWDADRLVGLGPLGTPVEPTRAQYATRSLARTPPPSHPHERARLVVGGFRRLELVSLLLGAALVWLGVAALVRRENRLAGALAAAGMVILYLVVSRYQLSAAPAVWLSFLVLLGLGAVYGKAWWERRQEEEED